MLASASPVATIERMELLSQAPLLPHVPELSLMPPQLTRRAVGAILRDRLWPERPAHWGECGETSCCGGRGAARPLASDGAARTRPRRELGPDVRGSE